MSTKKCERCGFLLRAKPLQAGQLGAVDPGEVPVWSPSRSTRLTWEQLEV